MTTGTQEHDKQTKQTFQNVVMEEVQDQRLGDHKADPQYIFLEGTYLSDRCSFYLTCNQTQAI